MHYKKSLFNKDCHCCDRLSDHLKMMRKKHPDYYNQPVPAFGDQKARFLIVGLAPGQHGANRTGRPFTGDYAGILLYKMLYDFGFTNQADSISQNDNLTLKSCRITNAVKCLPPDNKPNTKEIKTCNQYLREELQNLPKNAVILSLGTIAHNAVLVGFDYKKAKYPFAHAKTHQLSNGHLLLNSYHCSRYNTQTKRLTEKMFHDVFVQIKQLLYG